MMSTCGWRSCRNSIRDIVAGCTEFWHNDILAVGVVVAVAVVVKKTGPMFIDKMPVDEGMVGDLGIYVA